MPKVTQDSVTPTKAATVLASIKHVQKKKKKSVRVTAVINNLLALTKKVETLEAQLASTNKEHETLKKALQMRFEKLQLWVYNIQNWKQYMVALKNKFFVGLSTHNAWKTSVEGRLINLRSTPTEKQSRGGLKKVEVTMSRFNKPSWLGMKEQLVTVQEENRKLKAKLRLKQRKEVLQKRLS